MIAKLDTKMTKKELIARKNALAHDIRNIREDYKYLNKEDIPAEVTAEVLAMLEEMKTIQAALAE